MASLRAMIAALQKPGLLREGLLDTELAWWVAHDPERARVLLVVGSYAQARAVAETLAALRGDGERADVLALDRDGAGEPTWAPMAGTLLRGQLRRWPTRGARFLVAPLRAIERGHNILVGDRAAIGSVFFLTRPMLPPDFQNAVQEVNAWAMRSWPGLEGPMLQAGARLHEAAQDRWHEVLGRSYRFDQAREDDALVWTLLVPVWQCIGRLLRGGATARVHFVDAAWAPGRARGQGDTEDTSLLLRFAGVLDRACNDPSPAKAAVARALYGPARDAFATIANLQ